MADETPAVISQHPERNIAYGNAVIQHGQAWKQTAANRAQAISDAVDTLGDVFAPYKDAWHGATKPAFLAAHNSYGDACVKHGQNSVKDGHAFSDAEQGNATLVANVIVEGNPGGATSNGTSP